MQYKAFEQYAGTNPKSLNPAFLNLIRQIAPNQSPVLRFGGDSTDWTWWPVPGMKKPPRRHLHADPQVAAGRPRDGRGR